MQVGLNYSSDLLVAHLGIMEGKRNGVHTQFHEDLKVIQA
jgi:hypothetical protein